LRQQVESELATARRKIAIMIEQIKTRTSILVLPHLVVTVMNFCFEVSSRGRVRTNGSTPVGGKRKFAGQAPAGFKLKDDSPDDKGINESAPAACRKV
jgi:hypothetical protein